MFVNNLGCECCLNDIAMKRILATNLFQSAQALRMCEALDKLDTAIKGTPLCERSSKVLKILSEFQDTIEEMYKLDYL